MSRKTAPSRKTASLKPLANALFSRLFGRKIGKIIATIALALCSLAALKFDEIFGLYFESDYQHYELDSRFAPFFEHCSALLDKFYYLNCYDYDLRGSRAVAYFLSANNLAKHEPKRPKFQPDYSLPKHARTEWSDYLRSGFDRGHVLSNQSMNANKRAQEATFLMSNITPQWPAVNQGIWLEIEKRERALAAKWGAAAVLNVIDYPAAPKRLRAGNRPAIPRGYAKAICRAQTARGEDGKLRVVATGAAAGDLRACECFYAANEQHPKQKSLKSAKVRCSELISRK